MHPVSTRFLPEILSRVRGLRNFLYWTCSFSYTSYIPSSVKRTATRIFQDSVQRFSIGHRWIRFEMLIWFDREWQGLISKQILKWHGLAGKEVESKTCTMIYILFTISSSLKIFWIFKSIYTYDASN